MLKIIYLPSETPLFIINKPCNHADRVVAPIIVADAAGPIQAADAESLAASAHPDQNHHHVLHPVGNIPGRRHPDDGAVLNPTIVFSPI